MLKGILGALWSLAVLFVGAVCAIFGVVEMFKAAYPDMYERIKSSHQKDLFTTWIKEVQD